MSDKASDITEQQLDQALDIRSKKIQCITERIDALKHIQRAIQSSAFSDAERSAIDHAHETLLLQQIDETELLRHDTQVGIQHIHDLRNKLTERTVTLDALVSDHRISGNVEYLQYLQLFCNEQTRLKIELGECKRSLYQNSQSDEFIDKTPE